MPPRTTGAQQGSLIPTVKEVYEDRERQIREYAKRAISGNGHSLEFIARLSNITFPEQLGRALDGKGTHVPTRAYGVLLDPLIDEKRIFITGLAALSKVTVQVAPEIADDEWRRRVEQFARQDEMGALVLRKIFGDGR